MSSCPFCKRARGGGCELYERKYGSGPAVGQGVRTCLWARVDYNDISELETAMYKVKWEDEDGGQA